MQTNSKHSDSVCCSNSFISYREHRMRAEWDACGFISDDWLHFSLKLCAGLARSITLGLVSKKHGSWPEITFLWWSKTSSTVVEITQHAHKDGHASIALKLMVCCGLDQSQHEPRKSPSPLCHTAAASAPGFSDSNTHDALVFAVTSCGGEEKNTTFKFVLS